MTTTTNQKMRHTKWHRPVPHARGRFDARLALLTECNGPLYQLAKRQGVLDNPTAARRFWNRHRAFLGRWRAALIASYERTGYLFGSVIGDLPTGQSGYRGTQYRW